MASLWIAVLDSSLLQSVINTQRVVHLPGMKTKQIKMDPKLAGAMKNQLRAFKKKFGREPSRLLLIRLLQQGTMPWGFAVQQAQWSAGLLKQPDKQKPPSPNDPLFFDPDADTPQPISIWIVCWESCS